MSESKKLLIVTPANPLNDETIDRLRVYSEEVLGVELLVLSPGDKAQIHDIALADKIDKLCEGIANLVDINQALLEYMINADQGGEEAPMGSSLDG